MNLKERFDQFEDEYLKFERIEKPLHPRPDICGFLMLHAIESTKYDIIDGADHDKVYLNFGCEKLDNLPDDFIRDLRRCGIFYDDGNNSLMMFV